LYFISCERHPELGKLFLAASMFVKGTCSLAYRAFLNTGE